MQLAERQSTWSSSPASIEVVASMSVDGAAIVPNYFKDPECGIGVPYGKCYSIWAKKTSATRKGVILEVGSIPMNADFCFKLGTGTSTMLDPGSYIIMEAYATSYYIQQSNAWNDANWHCFHVNINSSQQLDLYKDGTLLKSGGSSLQLQSDVSSFNLKVGGSDNWDGRRNFAGLCTRVAVWNRALTASEIAEDYACKNVGAVASKDLIRFYGGRINGDGALYNQVNPKDGHLLAPYGNSTVVSTIIA